MLSTHDFILLFITGIFVCLSLIVPVLLVNFNFIGKHLARKLVHSFAGLAIFVVPYLDVPYWAIVMSALLAFFMYFSNTNFVTKYIFNALAEHEELHLGYLQGPFAYAIAITILMFVATLLPGHQYYVIASLMVMIYADTAASIVGVRYGKTKIYIPWVGSKRSLEGSFAFFVIGILVSFITYYFVGVIFPGSGLPLSLTEVYVLTFVTSLLGTCLELISPSKWDDLLIPLGVTLGLFLLF